jgi:hypothetical protein
MVYNGQSENQMDELGVPPFMEPPRIINVEIGIPHGDLNGEYHQKAARFENSVVVIRFHH